MGNHLLGILRVVQFLKITNKGLIRISEERILMDRFNMDNLGNARSMEYSGSKEAAS